MHLARVPARLLEARLDATYYRADYLAAEEAIRATTHRGARVRVLGDALQFFDTGVSTKSPGTTPLLKTRAIRDGALHFNDFSETVDAPAELLLRAEDVLLCTYGTGSIGKTAFVGDDAGARTVDYTVAILRSKTQEVDAGYLAAFLASRFGQQQIARHTKGTTGITFVLRSDLTRALVPEYSFAAQEFIGDKIRQANQMMTRARALTSAAQLLIEALVDGSVSESELLAAQENSRAGAPENETSLLARLQRSRGLNNDGAIVAGSDEEG